MENMPPLGDNRFLACLAHVWREGASDLFMLAGAPPTIKRQGQYIRISRELLNAEDIRLMAYSVMRKEQQEEFTATMECGLSYTTVEGDRFRFNVHMQRG